MADNQNVSTTSAPVEGEVIALFAFALGMIAGYNANLRTEENINFKELESFNFSGGKFDQVAGDQLLKAGDRWFLLELKRNHGALRDELHKKRVEFFLNKIAHTKNVAEPDILTKARKSHHFLYLGKPEDRAHLELATRPYIEWLEATNQGLRVAELSRPFTNLLREAAKNEEMGFSIQELTGYIQSYISGEEGSGRFGSAEGVEDLFLFTVTESRAIQALTHTQILELLKSHKMKEERANDTHNRKHRKPK